MRAILYSTYGSPDVLRLEEVARPDPAPDELLIRVHAAEATKSDCELRSFEFAVQWFAIPLRLAWGVRRPKRQILGGYFAGVVEAVGRDATRFGVGDEVFGTTGMRMGAYGEYVTLPEGTTIAHKPKNVSFEAAAAVPLGGLNALHFIRLANVRAGERVLVNGAGGSIGTFGVQIAKSMGAHVTAVDAAHKGEMLQSIGADRFVDYAVEDFTADESTYDVVFDMVAGSAYGRCLRALKPDGRYVTANPTVSKMLGSVFTSSFTRRSAHFAFAAEKLEELETLRDMVEAEQIRPAVDRVFPMEQAAAAHRRVEAEERLGVVVLSLV